MFLRKLTAGSANRSFGVEVAKLAGLPPTVVERARAHLAHARVGRRRRRRDVPRPVAPAEAEPTAQLGFSRPRPPPPASPDRRARGRRRPPEGLDPDELSPRAAHDLLAELTKKLTPGP